jgi:putative nucleotidyltransferase with HDIG domain/diguanylate cyclase (GGDEF)-like protein
MPPKTGPTANPGLHFAMKYASVLPSHETVRNVLDQKTLQLPSLPLVAVRLLELTLDDHSSADDLARVIETDPALAAKVLRIVNSAAYGLHRKIASVSQAVALLGFAGIRALALGVTLFERLVRKKDAAGFDRLFFWQHCLAVAALARILAGRLGYADPEEAYIAGLLHDVGKIILETHGRKGYSDFCRRHAAEDGGTLVENEARFVGLSHDRLGAFFCAHWQLPERLVLAVLFHHGRFDHLTLPKKESTLIAIVSLANFIAWIEGLGSVNFQQCPSLQPEVTALIDLNRLDRNAIAEEMATDLKAAAEVYGLKLPAPTDCRADKPGLEPAAAQLAAKHHYLHDLLARKAATRPAANLETRPGTPERISAVLRSIAAAGGFDRLQVMRLHPRRQCLQPVVCLDRSPLGLALKGFEIQLNPAAGELFEALRDGAPRIIRGHAASHQPVLSRLQASEIGVIPLRWGSRMAGMLWVDNNLGNLKLTDAALATAARMAGGLGRELAAEAEDPQPESAAAAPHTSGRRWPAIGPAVQKAFLEARALHRDLCVTLVAVENFQPADPAHNHLAADTLTRLVAGIIRNHCGPGGSVMPFGEDRFLALIMEGEASRAVAFGERLLREILELGLLLSQRRHVSSMKASIGLALLAPEVQTGEELTQRARRALEAARADNGGRVALYHRASTEANPVASPRDNWRVFFLEKDFISAG